jgi:hypothetical protein
VEIEEAPEEIGVVPVSAIDRSLFTAAVRDFDRWGAKVPILDRNSLISESRRDNLPSPLEFW